MKPLHATALLFSWLLLVALYAAHDAGAVPGTSSKAENVALTDRAGAARLWRRSRQIVRSKLQDKAPLEFRRMFFRRAGEHGLVTCGWVRPTTGSGSADAGLRFISDGTVSGTYLQTEVPGFGSIWREYCR